jgi:hypothetical protein
MGARDRWAGISKEKKGKREKQAEEEEDERQGGPAVEKGKDEVSGG